MRARRLVTRNLVSSSDSSSASVRFESLQRERYARHLGLVAQGLLLPHTKFCFRQDH